MYFFDFNDYISTARATYGVWSGTTILSGGMGLGGWRGGISADYDNYFGTARETYNAWFKAINEYVVASLNILKESTGSTISKMYYNDLFDAHEDYIRKTRIYYNSLQTSNRLYQISQIAGSFVGNYNDWLNNKINILEEVYTGNTHPQSSFTYNRPMASGGTISKTININYGNFNDIQFKDEYYDNYKASLLNLLRLMKTFMVLIDGDTFPDLQ